MATLDSLAQVIRSKNASPFRVTLDIFFADPAVYRRVKASGALTKETVALRYRLPAERVQGVYFVDQALGIKITLLKEFPSDHFLSRDCYGAQQHLPLSGVEIPD